MIRLLCLRVSGDSFRAAFPSIFLISFSLKSSQSTKLWHQDWPGRRVNKQQILHFTLTAQQSLPHSSEKLSGRERETTPSTRSSSAFSLPQPFKVDLKSFIYLTITAGRQHAGGGLMKGGKTKVLSNRIRARCLRSVSPGAVDQTGFYFTFPAC